MEEAKYRAFVNQYCIACHSKRAANPAAAPVNLEAAAFDDLMGHADTWERVLRKLSVRAMPPPGMPRPTEAEYAGFTSWLAGSLDHAWEGQSTPGRYVVHRLNRAEYANAVRDLLAVDIDVSDLLPTDGAEFGFDNIATALKTSPLLLEGYVNAAQRVSAMAVGDPQVRPGTTEHSIAANSARTDTSTACRSEQSVARLSIRFFRPMPSINCRAGWCGRAGRLRRRRRKRHSVHLRDHRGWRRSVFGSDWRSQRSRDQAEDLAAAQPVIDKRMTGRVRVTAGPHEVGFTWQERPFQLQDVWEPARRDSQEVHMVAGLPKLRTVSIDGPYNVRGVSEGPSRQRLFVCHPAASASRVAAKTAPVPPQMRTPVR